MYETAKKQSVTTKFSMIMTTKTTPAIFRKKTPLKRNQVLHALKFRKTFASVIYTYKVTSNVYHMKLTSVFAWQLKRLLTLPFATAGKSLKTLVYLQDFVLI